MTPTAYLVSMSDTPVPEYFISSPKQLGLREEEGWTIHHRINPGRGTIRCLHIRWPGSIFYTPEEAFAALNDYNNYCKAVKANQETSEWDTPWEERRTKHDTRKPQKSYTY